ncbi:MAG: NYN domain-containing protein, partial [Candidatus Limnocylindria bacterium]
MSKNVAVFVDVANLYYAARGQDVDVDYVALLKHATKGRDLIRAYAYSGLDPENENQKKFLDFLGKNGYKVVAKDIRKFGDGRVKANLDIELVVDLFRLADRMDVAVIVSGDGDFAPAIRALQDEGVRCEVISFKPNTSSDLFAVADEFVDVMKISAIGRQKDAKGVGAPEMPAKEVNPDVGFREASPSVAAAALAAIRSDGEDGAAGRGRSRGSGNRRSDRTSRPTRGTRSRTTDKEPIAIAESPSNADPARPAPRADTGDESVAEGARRRRRRGGRGRGRRGRRGDILEATPATADAEPAEISWQELDSLEELEGLGIEAPTGPD